MHILSSVLLFVSTALAYLITCPGEGVNYNTTGPNYVEWQRVDTDPSTFALFLTNVNNGANSQLLNSVVNGSLGITVANPPSGGWVAGTGYRLNFAQDSDHPDTLLAQSGLFDIIADNSTQSSTTQSSATQSSATQSGTTQSNTASGSTATQTNTGTATSSASGSATSSTPSGTNAAAPLRADTQAGFLTAFAAVAVLFTTLY